MRRLSILPAAWTDLIEIGDFIAIDNPDRAVSFVAEIEAKITAVATRPESFPVRDESAGILRRSRSTAELSDPKYSPAKENLVHVPTPCSIGNGLFL